MSKNNTKFNSLRWMHCTF